MLPNILGRLAGTFVVFVRKREIIHEPARLADLGHHLVTGVDAKRAGDALHLLTVSDVDPHGAHVHASVAVDTIPQAFTFLAPPPRLAAPLAVTNGDRVFVHHCRLDTRPWAGVDANLLTEETAKQKGCRGQNQHGGIGHRMRDTRHQIDQ